jgi:hypothetical protein
VFLPELGETMFTLEAIKKNRSQVAADDNIQVKRFFIIHNGPF